MVPELDILERYIAGELNSSEQEALEKMLKEDPLLADAIDGLKEVGDMSVARSSLARLYQSNRSRVSARAKKREQLSKRQSRIVLRDHMPLIMGIAAGLVILMVSVFIINKINNGIAVQNADMLSENTQAPLPSAVLMDTTREENEELEADTGFFAQHIPADELVQSAVPMPPPPTSTTEIEESEDQPPTTTSIEAVSQPVISPSESVPASEMGDGSEEIAVENNAESSDEDLDMAEPSPGPLEDDFQEENAAANTVSKPKTQAAGAFPRRSAKKARKQEGSRDLELPTNVEAIPLAGDTVRVEERSYVPPKISSKDSTYVAYYQRSQRLTERDNIRAKMLKLQVIIDLLYEGINAYRNEQFEKAREKFEEILRGTSDNVLAHHYNGLVDMEEEDFKAAIVHFQHNLNYPDMPIYEESRWYLTKAYLGAGKKRAAKKLLQEIADSPSPFQNDALIQLKEMN